MDRLVLSDVAWERMAPLIIGRPDQKGSTGRDNRMFVDAVLWIARAGAPWRDLPPEFGNWNSVFQRFRRWAERGVGNASSRRCRKSGLRIPDHRLHHRARPPACGRRKRGAEDEAIGRSRGGLSTKINAVVDALGNPLRFILTAGQKGDAPQAAALIEGFPAEVVMADTAYDADHLRQAIAAKGALAVINTRRSMVILDGRS